jgi:hypothetical protein
MSKTIRDIPDQAAVLLDANIVVYALYPQAQFNSIVSAPICLSVARGANWRCT